MTFEDPPRREPIFNVPMSLVVVIAVLVAIHALRSLLSEADDDYILFLFAFDPLRYDTSLLARPLYPGGMAASIWDFLTYALLHANLTHLGFNLLWLLPFGAAVARRFGAARFFVFLAIAAIGGAMAHLVTHQGVRAPMIGASAAISGAMAAAIRFAFQRNGPISLWRQASDAAYHVPALPLSGVLRDGRVLGFLAVWFGTNIVFGMGTVTGEAVAWEAHIGGFLTGLLLFSWFDPRSAASPPAA